MDILNRLFYGNTLKVWLFALGLALVCFLVLSALKKILGHRVAALVAGLGVGGIAIALSICRRFQEERIKFAYPTQTALLDRSLDPSDSGT
jgi:small-conductance mechanosensitive channel